MTRVLSRGSARVRVMMLALAGALVVVGASWLAMRPDSDFTAAEHACDEREFERAATHIKRFLERNPQDAEGLVLAARIERLRGDYAAAHAHLQAAAPSGDRQAARSRELEERLLQAQEGDLRRIEGLALEYADGSDATTARILEAIARGSLQILNPGLGSGGILAPRLKPVHSLGENAVRRWLELQPGPRDQSAGLVWRGRLHDLAGDHPAAMQDFQNALKLDPDSFDARLYYALSSRIERAPLESIAELEELHRRAPNDERVSLLLASLYRRVGRFDAAARLLDDLRSRNADDFALLLESGLLAIDRNQLAAAEAALKRARELDPRAPEVYLALSRCMRLAGRFDEMREFQVEFERLDAARIQPSPEPK